MSILNSAELLLQAKSYVGSGAWQDESGNGHHAQLGSTSGGDTNDPLFKAFIAADGQRVFLPGTSGNILTVPDSAALSPTGDCDMRVRVALPDVTPVAEAALIGKLGSPPHRAYYLRVLSGGSAGKLSFRWTEDGTTLKTETSSIGVDSVYSDDEIMWLRATIDVDNGASDAEVKFYTGGTGTVPVWTQLGTTQLVGATTSIIDGGTELQFGASGAGGSPLIGNIYEIQLYSDLTETTLVFDMNLADATEPYATFTERSSNAATVTINRSATGLVSTVVDRDMFLLTTDDFFKVPDDAGLNFAEADSFTLMVVSKQSFAPTSNDRLIDKRGTEGYVLGFTSTKSQFFLDAATTDQDLSTGDFGAVNTLQTITGVRDAGVTSALFLDGGGKVSTADLSVGSLTTTDVFYIGANTGSSGFYEGAIVAVAVWRKALTDVEVLQASTYLTSGGGGGSPRVLLLRRGR